MRDGERANLGFQFGDACVGAIGIDVIVGRAGAARGRLRAASVRRRSMPCRLSASRRRRSRKPIHASAAERRATAFLAPPGRIVSARGRPSSTIGVRSARSSTMSGSSASMLSDSVFDQPRAAVRSKGLPVPGARKSAAELRPSTRMGSSTRNSISVFSEDVLASARDARAQSLF